MKKFKKYILLIMALNVCFFAYESEKREAEAFAMSTAALILGGLAIVGGGAAILSRTGAGTLGEKVISGFEAAGGKIADLLNYNSVTDKGTLIMTPALKVAMNNAIGQLKSETSDMKADATKDLVVGGSAFYTGVYAKKGDIIRVSFDYVQGNDSYDGIYLSRKYASSNYPASSRIIPSGSGAGHYSGLVEVTSVNADETAAINIGIYVRTTVAKSGNASYMSVSNVVMENITTKSMPEYKTYQQYQSLPADSNERLTQINNTLTKSEYVVSANSVQENVSTIEQLESTLAAVEENTAGTNTLIDRMITALGNIPSAIKAEMSNLWADAGAIWSGMNDTLINIKADMNAKIGALSDSMAGGIDNIRTDIGAMMDRLSAGIDNVATSAAANMAAWGQLALDGIDAGVGTITNGLTSIWERVGAIPAAIDTAATTTAETIRRTFVMSEPQKLENEQNMTATRALLLQKFEWITTPIEDIKGLYGQRKSLYDVTFNVLGQEVHVLPVEYKGVISRFRPVVSGAAIMSTIIFIYRRIQPKEVV